MPPGGPVGPAETGTGGPASRDRAWIAASTWSAAIALVVSAALVVTWWQLVEPRPFVHIDHAAFLRTISYQQDGQNYYEAMQRAFHDIGASIGHARGFRIPTMFLIWRWIPFDLLYGAFLVLVVGSTAVISTRLFGPVATVTVTLYLLMAGRSVGTYNGVGFESWMLVELWLVPLAFGCVLAHRREADWTAAGLALAATLVRETAAVFLMGGLLAALLTRRTKAPWIVAAGSAVVLYAIHFVVASRYAEPPGNFARLFGTGDPPGTIWSMITWSIVDLPIVAAAIWALGAWAIYRSQERWLLLPVLLIPLNGVIVNRPYWGILLVPFLLAYGVDGVLEPFRRSRPSTAPLEFDVRRPMEAGDAN